MSEKPPSNKSVERLPFDPTRFLTNNVLWDNLSPDQKAEMLREGARHEIKNLIRLASDGDIDIEDAVDLIIKNAKV